MQYCSLDELRNKAPSAVFGLDFSLTDDNQYQLLIDPLFTPAWPRAAVYNTLTFTCVSHSNLDENTINAIAITSKTLVHLEKDS